MFLFSLGFFCYLVIDNWHHFISLNTPNLALLLKQLELMTSRQTFLITLYYLWLLSIKWIGVIFEDTVFSRITILELFHKYSPCLHNYEVYLFINRECENCNTVLEFTVMADVVALAAAICQHYYMSHVNFNSQNSVIKTIIINRN